MLEGPSVAYSGGFGVAFDWLARLTLGPFFLSVGVALVVIGIVRLRYRDWVDRPLVERSACLVGWLTGRPLYTWRTAPRRRAVDIADAILSVLMGLLTTLAAATWLFGWDR